MVIDPTIFKAYDIRGKYPNQVNEEMAYRLGFAFADLRQSEENNNKLTIVVSRDARLSSPSLTDALIKGLIESGVNVVNIGLASTPTLYFATAFYGYDGGIQISASHNPKHDNGFKLVRSRSVPVSKDSGMDQLRDYVIAGKYQPVDQIGLITTKTSVLADQLDSQIREQNIDLTVVKPFKIVIDTGNAMAALDIEALFQRLTCKLIKLNFSLNGNFPAHQPDPLDEKNLQPTIQAVLANHADFGIVPDGDGDRYCIIDNKGQVVRQEILRGIMAQIALKEHPGATIAYDIRPGKITLDMIQASGGKPLLTKVGHSLIKESMLKHGAVFGGESSGHYFYKFSYGTFESPFTFILKFLQFISTKNQYLDQIVQPLKKYYHSGEINSLVPDKSAKLHALAKTYADAKHISYLDGISIEYDTFWFNVRPSNTENKLRLNLEAVDQATMKLKRDEVLSLIRS